MWKYKVNPAQAGRRIDRLLQAKRSDLPYGRIQRLFREKQVSINLKPVPPNHRVNSGDEIMIRSGAGVVEVPSNAAVDFTILHEDRDILVVSKPAGMTVLPGSKQKTHTLVNGLLHGYEADLRPLGKGRSFGLTHRLDRDTSGLVVVARNPDAHQDLLDQFRRRRIQKEYRALVAGSPPRQEWTLQLPLVRGEQKGRMIMQVAPGGRGQKAVTEYSVLEAWHRFSYLDVRPKTGRTHQIRVHLAALGTPVLGDPLYGIQRANTHARHLLGLNRMFLHALAIAFRHPGTDRDFRVESPLPKDLEAVLSRLRSGEAE